LKHFRTIALLSVSALLGGCKTVVLDPAGDVAVQEKNLLILSTALMLLVLVPVIGLIVAFAWRYRASNDSARYEPDWDHSTELELAIWGGPLLIVIWLGALTWMGTHLLDPYRPIDRIADGQAVSPTVKPLEIDVVALDWKWLFIYPDEGIATVNEIAAPVDRPINFRITASSVMNSFYIPALAGQVYAMPGMETKLHAVVNKTGIFKGFSANYSGSGFSGMHFPFQALTEADFEKWVAGVKADKLILDKKLYLQLQLPSENEPAHTYGTVDPDLYRAILNRCAEPGKMCLNEMSAIDAKGGLGLAGINNVFSPESTKSYVARLCAPASAGTAQAAWPLTPADLSPIHGEGLSPPTPESSLIDLSADSSHQGKS